MRTLLVALMIIFDLLALRPRSSTAFADFDEEGSELCQLMFDRLVELNSALLLPHPFLPDLKVVRGNVGLWSDKSILVPEGKSAETRPFSALGAEGRALTVGSTVGFANDDNALALVIDSVKNGAGETILILKMLVSGDPIYRAWPPSRNHELYAANHRRSQLDRMLVAHGGKRDFLFEQIYQKGISLVPYIAKAITFEGADKKQITIQPFDWITYEVPGDFEYPTTARKPAFIASIQGHDDVDLESLMIFIEELDSEGAVIRRMLSYDEMMSIQELVEGYHPRLDSIETLPFRITGTSSFIAQGGIEVSSEMPVLLDNWNRTTPGHSFTEAVLLRLKFSSSLFQNDAQAAQSADGEVPPPDFKIAPFKVESGRTSDLFHENVFDFTWSPHAELKRSLELAHVYIQRQMKDEELPVSFDRKAVRRKNVNPQNADLYQYATTPTYLHQYRRHTSNDKSSLNLWWHLYPAYLESLGFSYTDKGELLLPSIALLNLNAQRLHPNSGITFVSADCRQRMEDDLDEYNAVALGYFAFGQIPICKHGSGFYEGYDRALAILAFPPEFSKRMISYARALFDVLIRTQVFDPACRRVATGLVKQLDEFSALLKDIAFVGTRDYAVQKLRVFEERGVESYDLISMKSQNGESYRELGAITRRGRRVAGSFTEEGLKHVILNSMKKVETYSADDVKQLTEMISKNKIPRMWDLSEDIWRSVTKRLNP